MNLAILKKGFKGKRCAITSTHGRQNPWQNPQEYRCNRPLPNKHSALLEGLMGGNAAAQQFKPLYLLAFNEYDSGHKLRLLTVDPRLSQNAYPCPPPPALYRGRHAQNFSNFSQNRRHTHD